MSALRKILDSGLLQGQYVIHDRMLAVARDGLSDERELIAALKDAMAGLAYVRQNHGDLYGVGFDRVGQRGSAILAKLGEPL